jgi:hypothetical protein
LLTDRFPGRDWPEDNRSVAFGLVGEAAGNAGEDFSNE